LSASYSISELSDGISDVDVCYKHPLHLKGLHLSLHTKFKRQKAKKGDFGL
jgi:hypothetical protein